ncbi:hypothetical protein SDC9_93883 [bioreactor metagenome]|uniref:Uncharacterized protein n=1 Tax=bioreactor metagenome TaxID=1076179 RepID=A0A645A1W0_9ZZZZ
MHKHRINQIVRRENVLTHQIAGKSIAAQTARTIDGKWSGIREMHPEIVLHIGAAVPVS